MKRLRTEIGSERERGKRKREDREAETAVHVHISQEPNLLPASA